MHRHDYKTSVKEPKKKSGGKVGNVGEGGVVNDMMWFYSASACIVESIIKEASGGLVPQGSATATLGSAVHCMSDCE